MYPKLKINVYFIFLNIGDLTFGITLIEYWWESRKKGDHWEDQDVGGWTIFKWILEG
jgi:hypothetical protein